MEKMTIKEFKDKNNIEVIEGIMKSNNGYITSKTGKIILGDIWVTKGKKIEKDLLKYNNEKKINYWDLYNDRNNIHKRQLLDQLK